MTNDDGRCLDLLPPAGSEEAKAQGTSLAAGQTYKIVFKTNEYFERTQRKSFYPWVEVCSNSLIVRKVFNLPQITFVVENPDEHYHVPLLISPYGFTTYRGS